MTELELTTLIELLGEYIKQRDYEEHVEELATRLIRDIKLERLKIY